MADFFKFKFDDGAEVILHTEVVKGVQDVLVITNKFNHHGKPVRIDTPLTDTQTKENFAGKLAGGILRALKELGQVDKETVETK